jgi:hypothetical protein
VKRLSSVAVTTISIPILGAALFADNAVAQQKSLKEQLVGTWTLVSADSVRNDGSKVEVFGPNPKGTLIYTSDGNFALVQMRSDLPKLASNSRDRGHSGGKQGRGARIDRLLRHIRSQRGGEGHHPSARG